MKKLYDEIMALKTSPAHYLLDDGYNNGIRDAAELAKKYDDEIERLKGFISEWSIFDD